MSEPEIVNPLPVEAAESWLRAVITTLLGDPYGDEFGKRLATRRRTWTPERMWGARDRDRWVGSLVTEQRTLTVPGAAAATHDLTVDALTGVAVAATHRRRGLLRQMLTRSLQAARDRGDSVAVLIAAEWPIYGRFGYAPATQGAKYSYHLRRTGGASVAGTPGRVRQIEPGDLGTIAPAVFDAARRTRPGQMDRRRPWWDRQLGLDGYPMMDAARVNWFVHDGADGPDGLLAWKVSRDFELNGDLGAVEVLDLVTTSDDAYRDLWAYLGGIDVIDEVVLDNRAVDEPVRWLLGDGRCLQQTEAVDVLWVRLLDVPVALAARGYAADGRIVLDVEDPDLGGYGAGRVVLTVRDGRAECTTTSEPADLRLAQRVLASLYLGGHRLAPLALGGGVEELTPGTAALVDVMFSTPLAPWNQTFF